MWGQVVQRTALPMKEALRFALLLAAVLVLAAGTSQTRRSWGAFRRTQWATISRTRVSFHRNGASRLKAVQRAFGRSRVDELRDLMRLTRVRGGSESEGAEIEARKQESSASAIQGRRERVLVSTTAGSKYIDQKLELDVPGEATVKDLKELIKARFPGRPPVSLQRLFLGSRLLKDGDVVGEILSEEGPEDTRQKPMFLLDMVPPARSLNYTSILELHEGLKAGNDMMQLNAYAANMVGLKYASQALTEHLLHPPGDHEEDEGEEGEGVDEEEGEPQLHTAEMRQEIKDLSEYLKKHYTKLPASAPVQGGAKGLGLIGGVLKEIDHPELESTFRAVMHQLNFDLVRTVRYAFTAYLFGRYGATGFWKFVMYALVPGVFILQLRGFRLAQKMLWELFAISPLAGGFLSAFLSAPQQILLTLDDQKYLGELYGEKKGESRGRKAGVEDHEGGVAVDEQEEEEGTQGDKVDQDEVEEEQGADEEEEEELEEEGPDEEGEGSAADVAEEEEGEEEGDDEASGEAEEEETEFEDAEDGDEESAEEQEEDMEEEEEVEADGDDEEADADEEGEDGEGEEGETDGGDATNDGDEDDEQAEDGEDDDDGDDDESIVAHVGDEDAEVEAGEDESRG